MTPTAPTVKDHIESRYALGDLPEEIATRLGAPLGEVLRIGEQMDAAARHVDDPQRDVCRNNLHPATPDNTYTSPGGQRTCRPCKLAGARARDRRKKTAQ